MKIKIILCCAFTLLLTPVSVFAHKWHAHGDHEVHLHTSQHEHQAAGTHGFSKLVDAAAKLNLQPAFLLQKKTSKAAKPEIAQHFEHANDVKTRWDATHLFIESTGLPEHNMMVGITNWQQQVPLPQPFKGNNVWKLPLNPKLAPNPISVVRTPLRGAIAIAVNGVPIFCALNNRGEDSYKLGELDKWGGHCGRGDDYHYHIAPVHLEKIVGKGNPIAFALDGFPIYGYTEADGSAVGKLDQFNGQFDSDGNYHYHATRTFPYINGGLRGVVTIRGDQIEQPRDSPVRPGLPPLRDAKIKGFEQDGDQRKLTYEVRGRTGTITFSPVGSDKWKFVYQAPNGRSRTETYQRRTPQVDGPPPNSRYRKNRPKR